MALLQGAGRRPAAVPVLWHLEISHYNEKARWALDYKRIPHVRRAAFPGLHSLRARRLTDGDTLPVLVLDGRAIGDSTRIIEALEEHRPDPPLYPADPAARARALALEDFFDEELGPYARRLFIAGWGADPKVLPEVFLPRAGAAKRRMARAMFRLGRRSTRRQLGISDAGLEEARAKLSAALERFRDELQPSGYLVGNEFTVADLTLASLLGPGVAPPQYSSRPPPPARALLMDVVQVIDSYGAREWVEDMFARHRSTSKEISRALAA